MKVVKFISTIFLLGLFVFISYFAINKYVLGDDLFDTKDLLTNDINEVDQISTIKHFSDDTNLNKKKPFAVLLLGLDSKGFENTRSDSIILSIINPKDNKVTLLSVYRDLLVDLPEVNKQDKLNAAYAYGGVDLTAATLQNLFSIPIEHYAIVNFEGFKDLVDAIGGVEIDVELNMNTKGRSTLPPYDITEGIQTLNGDQALKYVRFRSDGEGDFGRTRRQKQTLAAIADQTVSLRNITNVFEIYDSINSNMNSNISKMDMAQLAISMRNLNGKDIQSLVMDAVPTSRGGVSYVEATEEEINKISSILIEHLKGNYEYQGENDPN